MWSLRIVRNFALLAMLALAAHAAAGADKHLNSHCGGACGFFGGCPKGCMCINVGQGSSSICVPAPKGHR